MTRPTICGCGAYTEDGHSDYCMGGERLMRDRSPTDTLAALTGAVLRAQDRVGIYERQLDVNLDALRVDIEQAADALAVLRANAETCDECAALNVGPCPHVQRAGADSSAELAEALREFGQHPDLCTIWVELDDVTGLVHPVGTCNCGLDSALRAAAVTIEAVVADCYCEKNGPPLRRECVQAGECLTRAAAATDTPKADA